MGEGFDAGLVLVVLGLCLSFGSMSSECIPSPLPCSSLWSPEAPPSLHPWWIRGVDGGSGASSLNKHGVASDLKDFSLLLVFSTRAPLISFFFFSARHGDGDGDCGRRRRLRGLCFGKLFLQVPSFQCVSLPKIYLGFSTKSSTGSSIVVMEEWRRLQVKMGTADGFRELIRWWIWRGCGALSGCCLVSGEPPYSLVEWRRPSFLPSSMPKGRQLCSLVESMAWCYGDFIGPSGVVPGAGEVQSIGWRLSRAYLQFSLLLRVCDPSRLRQGLIRCNPYFA